VKLIEFCYVNINLIYFVIEFDVFFKSKSSYLSHLRAKILIDWTFEKLEQYINMCCDKKLLQTIDKKMKYENEL
jgi:hypothetical protein